MSDQPVTQEYLGEALDAVVETLSKRFDEMAGKKDLAALEIRMNERFTEVDHRVLSLKRNIDDLRDEFTGFTSDVYDELSGRIVVLEKKSA